jgi:hypothetical protein
MPRTIAVEARQYIQGVGDKTGRADGKGMNVNSVSDLQMTMLAKSLDSARQQATAVTSPENTVMQAAAAQQALAVATHSAGLVNTYV